MGIALNREQEIMLICGGAKESGLKIWDKVRMIEGLPLGNLSITQFFCRNSEFEFKAEVLIEVARQKDPPPVPVGVAKVLAVTDEFKDLLSVPLAEVRPRALCMSGKSDSCTDRTISCALRSW